MKPLFAILGVSMGIMLAVPAHAEPGIDEPINNENNGAFLADLQKVAFSPTRPRPSAPGRRYVRISTTVCPAYT